jgi:hypothetical protein
MFSVILLVAGLLGFNYFTSEHSPKEQNITTVLNKIKETNEKEFKIEVENINELNQVIETVNLKNKRILKIEKANNYKITIESLNNE